MATPPPEQVTIIGPDNEPLLLRTSSDVDSAIWDEAVHRLGGCCFHTCRWSRFSAEANSTKPLFFKWMANSGTCSALAVGMTDWIRVGHIPLAKRLSIGSLPAAAPGLAQDGLVRNLVEYARKRGFAALNLHSFGTPWNVPGLAAQRFSTTNRWEFLLGLSGTQEELWASLHVKKRNLIRKAQKSGICIQKASSLEDLLLFREIALETRLRKRARGIDFPEIAPASYYRSLKTHILDGGLGNLYLAYDGDKRILGGAVFVSFGESSYYLLSAANEAGLLKAVPDLILWTAMTDYQQAGCRLFNLGGLSEAELEGKPLQDSGLFHFKIRFAPEVRACAKGTCELRPGTLRLINRLRALKTGAIGR